MDDKLQTTFDMEESVYLRQLSFLILKKDKENQRMIVRKGPLTTLYYYFLIVTCIAEIAKNFYYIITPMTDIYRFYLGDMVSSTKDDQRLINLLLLLVYVGVWYLLIFFINGEHKRTFVYLFPFLLKMKTEDYVKRFNVKEEYSVALLKELKMRTRANLMSRVVYLGTLYSFYVTGIWMSFRKGVDKRIIFFAVFPTSFFGIFGISHFYFFLSDIISTYTIYCGFLAARLDRLSEELRKVRKKNNKKWFENHIYHFNRVLRDFEVAHLHFERGIMMWMPAFYCTFAIFPYCLLISEKMYDKPDSFKVSFSFPNLDFFSFRYTHGLLPHFVLNTFFLLFPLFLSNEKFTNAVSSFFF